VLGLTLETYVSVILAHQLYKPKVKFIEGPFTLGKWGTPINYIAVVLRLLSA
jgi:hypothetical protein